MLRAGAGPGGPWSGAPGCPTPRQGPPNITEYLLRCAPTPETVLCPGPALPLSFQILAVLGRRPGPIWANAGTGHYYPRMPRAPCRSLDARVSAWRATERGFRAMPPGKPCHARDGRPRSDPGPGRSPGAGLSGASPGAGRIGCGARASFPGRLPDAVRRGTCPVARQRPGTASIRRPTIRRRSVSAAGEPAAGGEGASAEGPSVRARAAAASRVSPVSIAMPPRNRPR